jgi:uncharacterized protein
MIYLDTNLLLSVFVREPESDRLRDWFETLPPHELTVSEWTRTEFVSAIGTKARRGALEKRVAEDTLCEAFTGWQMPACWF